jgi:hypothetical protein
MHEGYLNLSTGMKTMFGIFFDLCQPIGRPYSVLLTLDDEVNRMDPTARFTTTAGEGGADYRVSRIRLVHP